MKKHKLIKFLLAGSLLPIISIPIVSLKVDDTSNIKLNKNSDISISKDSYDWVTNMFKAYYKKLNIPDNLTENKNYIENKHNKVGIIETDDIDETLLLSKNKNFSFNKMKKDYFRIGSHSQIVTSIVGTDMGINPSAEMYFPALNYKTEKKGVFDPLEEFIQYMIDNGVNIINLSLGYITELFTYDGLNNETLNDDLLDYETIPEFRSFKGLKNE
ncbi:hypothetical protein [Mycoplasma seminis]|uniref:Peptidase S8/S53 domain-containing protein n=1 Tax=Mycoplasma seminis TaxID=512749 RepID=A0ABY9HBI9_9MOLU|nr:hypothetical protein [Mycoplasma seminis]WLP85806.1 hypothetical protein Q8852_01520 [Mycoplasma seminis]